MPRKLDGMLFREHICLLFSNQVSLNLANFCFILGRDQSSSILGAANHCCCYFLASQLLFTLSELAPVSDLPFIIKCCKTIQDGQKIMGETDILTLLAPFELLSAALYEHYFFEDGVESRIESKFIKTGVEFRVSGTLLLSISLVFPLESFYVVSVFSC